MGSLDDNSLAAAVLVSYIEEIGIEWVHSGI
jgi:hypothetical protein